MGLEMFRVVDPVAASATRALYLCEFGRVRNEVAVRHFPDGVKAELVRLSDDFLPDFIDGFGNYDLGSPATTSLNPFGSPSIPCRSWVNREAQFKLIGAQMKHNIAV
jgi:hypothetical protein